MNGAICYGSICSGIEAVSEAVKPLGWQAAYFSEIEDAPIAVLKHRHRAVDLRHAGAFREIEDVSLWGDFSALRVRHLRRFCIPIPDVLVGGTPCQSFSVAGSRLSLSDARGNLALAFVRHAHAINNVRRQQGRSGLVVLWENVPGVLSTDDNAFGCLLAGFVGSDTAIVSPLERGRWPSAGMVAGPLARAAWRVLDAQYFGVAQRRERVFLVVSLGDGPDPAEILFERCGVLGNPAPRREARQDVAPTLSARTEGGGGLGSDFEIGGGLIPEIAHGVKAADKGHRHDSSTDTYIPEVAWALQERDAKGADSDTKDGHLIIDPIAFSRTDNGRDAHEDLAPTLRAMNNVDSNANGGGQLAVAFNITPSNSNKDYKAREASYAQSLTTQSAGAPSARGGDVIVEEALAFKPSHYTRGKDGAPSEIFPPLSVDADNGDQEAVVLQPRSCVRRLIPRECERLQGFGDDYTLVPFRGGMMSDSARYRMLGNSMAVPVIRWLAGRIERAILNQRRMAA